MSARSRLLSLYPKEWRERYGVEFEALLEHTALSPRLVGDVVVAALGAQFAQLWRRPGRLHAFGGSAGRGRIARVVLSLLLATAPVASGAVGYYLGSRDREADMPTLYPATESAFRTYPTGTFTVFCQDVRTMTWVALTKGSSTCPAAP